MEKKSPISQAFAKCTEVHNSMLNRALPGFLPTKTHVKTHVTRVAMLGKGPAKKCVSYEDAGSRNVSNIS